MSSTHTPTTRGERDGRGAHRTLPLQGRHILVTRPRAQSRVLCDRLRRLGARPVAVPAIGIVPLPKGPLDRALAAIARYDWVILTSANGARACIARAKALRLSRRMLARPRWAAIGPATAAVLRAARIRVAMVPSRYLSTAIAAELPEVVGRRILLARTDAAPPRLARALRARGAQVDEVPAYKTVLAPRPLSSKVRRLLEAGLIDTILFTSASTVHGLLRLLENRGPLRSMTIACIGPVCASAVRKAGLRPSIVAEEHTIDGLIKALLTTPSKGASDAPRRAAQ